MVFGGIDFPDENLISALLGGAPVTVLDSAVSTNTELWASAANGAPSGTVLIAKRQSGGRGRLGRSFSSEEGGLYLSLLLRPQLCPEDTCLITPVAALAVAEAIERHTKKTALIKWVNDVYTDGKKVCGILTEACVSPVDRRMQFVIVGVGLNVYEPYGSFPKEILQIAGALFPCNARSEGLMSRLAADIIKGITQYAEDAKSHRLLCEYKNRCFITGNTVNVYRGTESFTANAVDIDDRYGLVIEDENGKRQTLTSGEVSVRKAGGEI